VSRLKPQFTLTFELPIRLNPWYAFHVIKDVCIKVPLKCIEPHFDRDDIPLLSILFCGNIKKSEIPGDRPMNKYFFL